MVKSALLPAERAAYLLMSIWDDRLTWQAYNRSIPAILVTALRSVMSRKVVFGEYLAILAYLDEVSLLSSRSRSLLSICVAKSSGTRRRVSPQSAPYVERYPAGFSPRRWPDQGIPGGFAPTCCKADANCSRSGPSYDRQWPWRCVRYLTRLKKREW